MRRRQLQQHLSLGDEEAQLVMTVALNCFISYIERGLPISSISLACGMLTLITHNYMQVVHRALAGPDTTCFNSYLDTAKFLVWLWICATIGSSHI
jgi:hypothetical protein